MDLFFYIIQSQNQLDSFAFFHCFSCTEESNGCWSQSQLGGDNLHPGQVTTLPQGHNRDEAICSDTSLEPRTSPTCLSLKC